jgi:hypothetical protein
LLAALEDAKRSIKHLRSQATKREDHLATTARESEELLKSTKRASRARIVELYDRLRVQNSDLAVAQRSWADKIAVLESRIADLTARMVEAELQKQKGETRTTAIIADCEREKKSLQATLGAQIHALELENGKIQEKYRLSLGSFRASVYEILSSKLGKLIGGTQRIDEHNLEVSLDIVRQKVEAALRRDLRIRTLLCLAPNESIEDAIAGALARNSGHFSRTR